LYEYEYELTERSQLVAFTQDWHTVM